MKKFRNMLRNPRVIGLCVVALIILCGYNVKNNQQFFEVGVYQLISLIITVVIAYALVQFRNDERKQKEIAEKLARQIQDLCFKYEEKFLLAGADEEIDENCWREMLMAKRTISNKIDVLEGICVALDIKAVISDIDKVKEQFEGFNTVQGDIKTVDATERFRMNTEMRRYLHLIDERCDKAILNLYTKS